MNKTETAVGNFRFEISLLEDIFRRDRDDPRTIEVLANLYTVTGQIEKGLELDRRHIALEPKNPSAYYNCACSLSLSGQIDEAFEKLKTALDMGFESVDWMHKDPDLEALRDDPRWMKLPVEQDAGAED
ncbi:MAG: hypothetical protein WC360_01640 [Opitutales bacterium]|jgi:adenylate cyclase